MKKCMVKRKIRDEEGIVFQDILAYKYHYNNIDYAIYNTKDYDCQYYGGYISILISDNHDVNGLALIGQSYKTIKETINETNKVIDNNIETIKRLSGEVA